MSDFREYKAAFLEQNDLKHYGVKGMKWEHKKRKPGAKQVVIDDSNLSEWLSKYERLRRNAKKKIAKKAARRRKTGSCS